MTNVLRPLPVDEFVRLAAHAGLEVSRDDLEQLERRRLIQPYDSGSFSRLHLYLLAVYFDAVRCFRHPWAMKQSDRSIDDVKKTSQMVFDVMKMLDEDGGGDDDAERMGELAIDIERFLAGLDPFGPIGDLIDLLREDVREALRGDGRLYVELRRTASALADAAERVGTKVSLAGNPATREVPEKVLRETAELTTEDVGDVASGFDEDEVEVGEESEPEDNAAPAAVSAESAELGFDAASSSEVEIEIQEPSEPEAVASPEPHGERIAEPTEPSEPSGPEIEEPSSPPEIEEPSPEPEIEQPSEPEVEIEEPSEPEVEIEEPSEPEVEIEEPSEAEEADEEEPSEPELAEESSEPELAEESSDPELAEETSEPELDEESSEPELDEESSEPELAEESSEPELAEESSEPELAETESTPSESERLGLDVFDDSEPESLGEDPSQPLDAESFSTSDAYDDESDVIEPMQPQVINEPVREERPADADAWTDQRSEPAAAEEEEDDFEDFPAEDTELTESSSPGEFDEAPPTTIKSESETLAPSSDPEDIPQKPDNPFARENPSGRTQALLDRLDEIKAQRSEADVVEEEDEPQEEQPAAEELEEKVNELNLLREKLIRAQDWAGLVSLYEERMDLFDAPADRQQVFLTLATLYELKLGDDDNAFRCFDSAFAIGVREGQFKTLDSLRKIGNRANLYDRYSSWLERQIPRAKDSEVRLQLQRDLAEAHRKADHPQRAFLSYAAFLAEDPGRITPSTLDFLEKLAIEVDDDELAGFFDDILEHDASDEVKSLVALRAGAFYLGSNQPHHAIRHFRLAFDHDPTSDIAYSNLARLYEREENWGDLRSLIAEKLKTADEEEAKRLRRELGRVVSHETSSASEGDSL